MNNNWRAFAHSIDPAYRMPLPAEIIVTEEIQDRMRKSIEYISESFFNGGSFVMSTYNPRSRDASIACDVCGSPFVNLEELFFLLISVFDALQREYPGADVNKLSQMFFADVQEIIKRAPLRNSRLQSDSTADDLA